MHSRLPTPTMVSRIFLANKSNARRTQPPKRPRTKVILSSEARKILNLDQQGKKERFHRDLDDAFEKLDEMTKTIVSKHGKSIHRVKTSLYLGHAKFRTQRKNINPWNTFCWKKHQWARENGMYVVNIMST